MSRPEDRGTRGDAYLVQPDDGPGPGVLVLHSWWGLTPAASATAEALADRGYTALAPDLCDGRRPEEAEEARRLLAESDPNLTADLVLRSVSALRGLSADPSGRIAVVGFSMGASWALWLATRSPAAVAAVVAYYGTQNIDFDDLEAPVLGHYAESDELVSEDELVEMQARLLLSDKHVEVHRYPGTRHWFAEDGPGGTHDPVAGELAWDRTVEFLGRHLPVEAAGGP